jgi:hypothetical protein
VLEFESVAISMGIAALSLNGLIHIAPGSILQSACQYGQFG